MALAGGVWARADDSEAPQAPQTAGPGSLTPDQLEQQHQAIAQDRGFNLVTPEADRVFQGVAGKPVTQANVDKLKVYLADEQGIRQKLVNLPDDQGVRDQLIALISKPAVGDPVQDRDQMMKDIRTIMKSNPELMARYKQMRREYRAQQDKNRSDLAALKDGPFFQPLTQTDVLAAVLNLPRPPDGGGKQDNAPGGQLMPPPLNAAQNALQNGDGAAAMDNLNDAISDNPSDGQALSLRAGLNYANGNMSAAASDAQAALGVIPGDARASKILAMTQGRSGYGSMEAANNAGALGADQSGAGGAGPSTSGGGSAGWLAGLAVSPNAAPAAAAVREGSAALGVGDTASAIKSASAAIALNPGSAQAYNLRAVAYNRTHQFALALKDAVEGLKIAPKDVSLLLAKAAALNKLHRYAEAEAVARQILELDPSNAAAYNALAEALAGQHKNGAAIAALQTAAKLDPVAYGEKAKQAVQLPAESDLSFLFPDDDGAGTAPQRTSAASAADKARKFKMIVMGSLALGLALGFLLIQFFAPKIKEALTRLTRRGPAVGVMAEEEGPALSGLLTEKSPGLLRGQYQLGRQIGEGGMGLVFEGQDTTLKRRVAIKKMRGELRDDARERARFIAEAKVVAALHHPSIVDIYAIAEDGNDVYLVFEFVSGRTLHEIVHGGGRMTLEKAVPLYKAVGEAVDFAHARNVIHRDLKPSNIMVDGEGRIKVMDFGIARLAKDAMSRVSMTNTVVGTPPYMAPEQEQGVVRRESDVYALAVCLYESLAGRLPFNSAGGGMLMNKIKRVYAPLSNVAPGLPAGIDDVFAKAFDPDPEKRYHSSRELIAGLEALALPQRG